MNIFRIVLRILGLLAMGYFAFSGLSGVIEPWLGGVGWALLAILTVFVAYAQRKDKEINDILHILISNLEEPNKEGENDES
jgi:Ca2+/Na+ antiporter